MHRPAWPFWGLFVTTTRRDIEILVYNHIQKSIFEDSDEYALILFSLIKLIKK